MITLKALHGLSLLYLQPIYTDAPARPLRAEAEGGHSVYSLSIGGSGTICLRKSGQLSQ